jgi:hypothetical protein
MRRRVGATVLLALVAVSRLPAQEPGAAGDSLSVCSVRGFLERHAPDTSDAGFKAAAGAIAEAVHGQPVALNKVLNGCLGGPSRLLSGLNLEFKTFKVGGSDSSSSFGLGYSYARDLTQNRIRATGANQTGMALSVNARGDIAFERRANPNDFLEGRVSAHLFGSWGGFARVADTTVFSLLNALEDSLASIEDPRELAESPLAARFGAEIRQYLSTQYYLDFSLETGLEANQDFSTKQVALGALLGVDLKPWGKGYLNLFDWPFAAIRWLTGYDAELEPRGSTFPTVIVGLDRMNPTADSVRQAVADLKDYWRFRAEAAFRTDVSAFASFEADLRYYRELDAPAAVRSAGLDRFTWFTAALTTTPGPFFSFSTGHLPFDAREDQVYALGFRYRF